MAYGNSRVPIKGTNMTREDSDTPYKDLAIAAIHQAVLDHYDYHRQLKMWEKKAVDPDQSLSTCKSEIRRCKGMLKDIKAFFYGQYFMLLSDADGPSIWREIERNWNEGRKPKMNMIGPSAGNRGNREKRRKK